RIEALQAEIFVKEGALNSSSSAAEQALRRLGNWVPMTSLGLGYGIIREAFIQCWHTLWPGRLHRREADAESQLTLYILRNLSNCYVFRSTPQVIWSQLLHMNRAEMVPPGPDLARGYSLHGCLMSMLGWLSRGAKYGTRSREIASRFEDLLL